MGHAAPSRASSPVLLSHSPGGSYCLCVLISDPAPSSSLILFLVSLFSWFEAHQGWGRTPGYGGPDPLPFPPPPGPWSPPQFHPSSTPASGWNE